MSNSTSSFESGMRNLNLGHDSTSYHHSQQQQQQQQHHQQHYSQPPNQGGGGQWNQGQYIQQQYRASDDEDDDQPLSYQQQQQASQGNNFPRPVSVRNMAIGLNSAKPSNFIKPAPPQSNSSIVPQDMSVIQSLYENYSQKVYFEGYVYKKNDLTVDGKSFGDPKWSKWYVELCGPVLTLWDTQTDQSENVMPQYINITDSNVELVGRSGEPGRENVFSLNSAGANRYLFDVPDFNTLVNWVCAIRLSCFECSKLQEIFTRSFVSRSAYADVLAKPMSKMEGFVQVRFSGTTEWQKYWVVVSDRKEEKKLFSKKSVQSRGQMMFYESKKAKSPVLTMVNVVQSYILYPESPQAIDLVTMFKVEGSTFTVKLNGEQQPAASYSSALIMASTPKELVQWTIGTFDAFKLYGRPSRLNDDPLNINSLNFGEPKSDLPRLFLEVPEVAHLNFSDETLLDNKAQFAGILLHKMQQQQQQPPPPPMHRQSQQPMGLIHQIPSGAPMYNNQSPRPTSQRMSTYSSQSSSIRSPLPQPTQQQQQQQQRMNAPAPGRRIYASDEGSDDDDEEEEEEEDSDRDSVFNKKSSKLHTKESLSLPPMTASEDDGFASSILGDIEKRNTTSASPRAPLQTDSVFSPPQPSAQTLPTDHSSNTSLPTKEKGAKSEDEFGLSDSEDEEPTRAPVTSAKRPTPKMARTQVSLSGSDTEDEEDAEDDASYSGSDDDVPIHQQQQHQQQQRYQQQQYMDYNDPRMQYQQGQPQWDSASMMEQQQQYFDEDGYPIMDEDGPVIPQLGDRFATQNSLLDTYRPDRASAHDQEGYARATGQPLIQVPNKPPEPRAGLVGMISQIEHEKKQKESSKNRFGDMDRDRMMDRERERYMMDQRAQMMQPMMGQGMNMMGQPMMYPGMNPAMMQMMGGQMPMMNLMGQPIMYPGMMQMQNPSMMNMQMMPQMMDPRMSMMMMQQQYGQYPMWQPQQQAMFGNPRFNGIQEEDDDDEDDDVPLGAKESLIPRNSNNNQI
ncbi:uncharacterized protein ATC70_002213 [Mucor velutinosus]|uniref:PH domain-containing protein n=1 Tax=Mucor velutinosus TaxID=708070 RepID=A0AAN7HZA9_9FUNG|nr:hypothetical protein ATC70_002213 [Mucor velutinosus]